VVCHHHEQPYCQATASRKCLHNIRKRTQEISQVQTGISKPNIARKGRAEFEMGVDVDEKRA
jgi:hypothetical protein